jgi:AcrR family transcriptional regulator
VSRVAKRRYEQRLRAEAAEQTRRRVLDAFRERLTEGPAKPVSVDEVARRAGVARSTVYLVFGSRAGLFDALVRDLTQSAAGFQRLLDALRDPDARAQLRGALKGSCEMFAEHREVIRVLWSMARTDADAAGDAVAAAEQRRAEGMQGMAQRLHEQGALRPDVSPERAADVIWLLASFDAYDQLATGRGLDVEEVADILATLAERSLLVDGVAAR